MTQNKKTKDNLVRESIERLIEEEIDQALLEEGLVDWVKEKFSAAGDAVKQGWEQAAAKAKQLIDGFQGQVATAMKQAAAQKKQMQAEAGLVQQALTQNGSNINALPGYGDVYAFLQAAPAFSQEMAKDLQTTQQFVAQNNQGQATQQEAAFVQMLVAGTQVMKEVNEEMVLESLLKEADELSEGDMLNEGGILGLALATPTFLNLTLRALAWIAGKFKSKTAQDVAGKLKKAAHWIHHTEHAAIDKVLPNAAAYAYYRAKTGATKKLGIAGRSLKATGGQTLNYDQFKANDKVRVKTKVQMYKLGLIFFLVTGIEHVLHGIHNAFEGAEAAATAIKGFEIGAETAEVVTNLGSLAGAAAETVELADIGGIGGS